jgi:nucleoredoxin
MNPLIRNSLAALAALLFASSTLVAEDTKLFDVLPETLEDAKGKKMDSTELKGKFVGLYFSAGWCPPCRAFTPHLVEFRNAHSEEFEVVFVSFDKSNMEKQKYIRKNDMPWPSLAGAGRKDSKVLSQMFQIQGLPTLIVLSPEGNVVSLTGRTDVMSSAEEALETWKKASQS